MSLFLKNKPVGENQLDQIIDSSLNVVGFLFFSFFFSYNVLVAVKITCYLLWLLVTKLEELLCFVGCYYCLTVVGVCGG